MGKRPPSPTILRDYARLAADRIRTGRLAPVLKPLASSSSNEAAAAAAAVRSAPAVQGGGQGMEEPAERVPLSEVVSDCVRRWFQDALKEARAGDAAMQVLVGQMYKSGYGVPRNEQKAKAWITRASKFRSSVWKVSDKRPGYNASDSDSDELEDAKNC